MALEEIDLPDIIFSALSEVAGVSASEIRASDELSVLGIDSMGLLEASLIVEESIGVEIDARRFEGVMLVSDVLAVIGDVVRG